MSRIVDFSLNNRLIVIIVWLLVAAAGVNSLTRLPIDAVPDVTNIQVQVLTNSPGLPPEEVERFITFPVETAMSGLPAVEEIRSVSKFGLSVVTIVFEEGTDIYWARQLVGERLVEAREEIPEGYGEPAMGPISTGLGEIYQFEVRGEGYTPMELRTILDWYVNYQLRSVPGIVEVNSFGGELKTYQVTLDPGRLTAYGISVKEILDALESNNRNVGGGYIAHHGEQYLIRGEGLIETLEDLGDIIVTTDEHTGTPIYIKDLGRVEFAPMIRQGAVTRDGRGEAVVGIVMMLMGANSRVVVDEVKQKIEKIKKSLPEGVTIDTYYDRTELVHKTIKTVAKNLIEGGILVIVILLLFLGNVKGGLIVASAIPLSMLVAFSAMRLAGLSGNLMSLGAIDFGLIVDGSVVMIENVVRYLSEHRDDKRPHIEKVRAACREVARPVVFAVGIIIIVYLPILALTGVEGKMFKPMALTVVFALAGSLVCAMTLMPVLASLFLVNIKEKEPLLFSLAKRVYRPVIKRVMGRPAVTFGVALSVFAASISFTPFMGTEFIPELDEGAIALQIWRLPSVSLEKSNEISTLAERVLKEEFAVEIDTIVSRTGRAEIATDPMGVEISDTYIMLNPREQWRYESKEALIEAMDEVLKERVPGAIFSYSQPIELRVAELISGVRSDVAIKIYGDDLELMKKKADEVVRIVREVPGAADTKAEQVIGLPTMRVRIDRQAIARYGINAEDILDVIQAIGGKEAGVIVEGQKRFTLQVRFDESVRRGLDRIGDLKIEAPVGAGDSPRLIPLSQLASIEIEEGPAQISRENISRRITVETNVRGRDLGSFVAEAQDRLDREFTLPPGWYMDWGGQFENLQEASRMLALLVPVALLLIFVLLYSTFNSARLAALIYLNVPMAVTGGVFALLLRGYPFSISAGVGFIALFGVAVLNGVVLVSYIVQKRKSGASAFDAAAMGAMARLRPVLMTALVASFGFVPMALATSAGAEVQRPLATVVIGGLVTSTLLTLLVLPSVYRWFAGDEGAAGGRAADRTS
ncbi:MAG TPA: efflux RND transporter permease subunit [Deltaproteobacteria bacterium]|nr:efflux RND transporter permease subunit [Deltaproteobacteria bacterium]